MDGFTRNCRYSCSFCSCCWLFNHLIADVHKKLDTQHSMIVALIDRIRQMDNDMIRIDSMVRTAMGVTIDVDRLARADGKKDQRKD